MQVNITEEEQLCLTINLFRGDLVSNIVDEIHNMFLLEARNSPLLFNDLANMENYISESYAGRSLIELIQNADDALASSFLVEQASGVFFVANDGRFFNEEDLLSLCRSGSSTKKRNSDTIGFRGIGFKSVVNYSRLVHLISGNIRLTFSKELTSEELGKTTSCPLVRVPHVYAGSKHQSKVDSLLSQGYTTIFIFEVLDDSFCKELTDFSCDYLIFLKHLKNVKIVSASTSQSFLISRDNLGDGEEKVSISDTNTVPVSWILLRDNAVEGVTAAVKFDGKTGVPADASESVLHSFLPTRDFLSFGLKLNGDFSTDPSRTRIVRDAETLNTIEKCAELLTSLIGKVLLDGDDPFGLANILKDASVNPLSSIKGETINDSVVLSIKKHVGLFLKSYSNGKQIVLQPNGITDEDFDRITSSSDLCGFGCKHDKAIPGIVKFLSNMGVKQLSSAQCLEAMRTIECSSTTRSSVVASTIKETRFGLSGKEKDLILNAKLFEFENGVYPISENPDGIVSEVFEGSIKEQLTSSGDYPAFIKRIGLKETVSAINQQEAKVEHSLADGTIKAQGATFGQKKALKKWRTVEMNVAEALKGMQNITSVRDVSFQNTGYDLEAICADGSSRYYEVKSIDSLGDPVSLSNNEYSTASIYKDKYYLAIVSQKACEISFFFIKNPTDCLTFEKRVTRWDWICTNYEGELITFRLEE